MSAAPLRAWRIAPGGTVGGSLTVPGDNNTPGTSTTFVGNLAFQAGAQYIVAVNPTTANFTTVTGATTKVSPRPKTKTAGST